MAAMTAEKLVEKLVEWWVDWWDGLMADCLVETMVEMRVWRSADLKGFQLVGPLALKLAASMAEKLGQWHCLIVYFLEIEASKWQEIANKRAISGKGSFLAA